MVCLQLGPATHGVGQIGLDAFLHQQVAGAGFVNAFQVAGNAKTRPTPLNFGSREILRVQSVLRGAGGDAGQHGAANGTGLQQSGGEQQRPPVAALQLVPQRVGSLHEGNIIGVLEVCPANDSRLAVGAAAVVSWRKAVEP